MSVFFDNHSQYEVFFTMKKTIKFLLIAPFICLHLSSFSMEPVDNSNKLIPDTYTLNIPSHVWFSGVGSFVACLGALLVYRGAQKTSESSSEKGLNSSSSNEEGGKLMGSGALLFLAGALTIWLNKK